MSTPQSDLEPGKESQRNLLAVPAGPSRGCFPLDVCFCLPWHIKNFVPKTLVVIQDWTHLSLFVGIIGSSILLFMACVEIFPMTGSTCWNTGNHFCIPRLITLVATVPGCKYFFFILGTYDESILLRQAAVAERKKELTNTYEELVASIDDLLGKAAESSATMAERSFESKRRDFQHFLEHSERRYASVVTTESEAALLLDQFRRFVKRWLVVFEECSIDPIACPKKVVTEEELDRCRTVGEVATLTVERLKQTEVRFISSQRDKDAKVVTGYRKSCNKWTPPMLLDTTAAPGRDGAKSEIELQETSFAASSHCQTASSVSSFDNTGSANDLSSERGSTTESPSTTSVYMSNLASRRCPCDWFKFGAGFGCRHISNEGSWPHMFQCKCAQLGCLSLQHFYLQLGCILSVGMIPFISLTSQLVTKIALCLFIAALIWVLVHFEQIDVIQQLENEISELVKQSDRVAKRREEMVGFWEGMQQLTDLWVHRTVPRLDLLKEVQSHLEYAPPGDSIALMSGANQRLEDLENNLPDMSYWRNNGQLTTESKKAFGEAVLKLCQEETLPKILTGLNHVIDHKLPQPEIGNTPVLGTMNPALMSLGVG